MHFWTLRKTFLKLSHVKYHNPSKEPVKKNIMVWCDKNCTLWWNSLRHLERKKCILYNYKIPFEWLNIVVEVEWFGIVFILGKQMHNISLKEQWAVLCITKYLKTCFSVKYFQLLRGWIFLYDNHPHHITVRTRKGLKAKKIRVLEWPSRFPIENLKKKSIRGTPKT